MSKAKTIKKTAEQNIAPTTVKGKVKAFFSYNKFILLAFAIPFVLMTVAFGIMGVSPVGFIGNIFNNIAALFTGGAPQEVTTGDKQILVTDLWHQYYPFLVDLQDKLKEGESLFWSWTQGSGVNYFALMSYYLASPLNFLTVFLPKGCLREFLMFSVAIKIALAGMFMAIFLRSAYKKNDFSLVIFGCCFSFCAFFMGYYWNTIWLDTVCITPLVVLGAYKLFTENKFRLYTITLALSLLTNYYIGFFTCIFVLLIFIAYNIAKWDGFKNFFNRLVRTGLFSLLAIGITAFFLLPAFFGLQNTNATGSTFPSTFDLNISDSNTLLGVLDAMKQIFSNFLTFIEPATKAADALPNIACGTVALVLGVMFFTSKKISLKEKCVDIGLVLFMLVSCVIRQLDYIWHGFHFTNMIPYRFSYLVSFVLVVMAFRAFMLIDFASMWDVLLTILIVALVIILSIDTQENYVLIGTIIIAALICSMLLLYTTRVIPKNVLMIVLAIVVISESMATAYIGVKTTTVTGTFDYPRGEEETAQIIAQMDSLEENTPELWRAEMTSTQTLNDGSLNDYNGLSMFNSMANVDMTRFFENFGMMGWKSGNRYTYAEGSPVTNMFMNLKYIISRDGMYQNTYDLSEVYTVANKKLLKNEHYIPMGFMVNDELVDWRENNNEDQFNPFDQQNDFFKKATGIEKNVYTPLDVVTQGHTDSTQFTVNRNAYGSYSFSCVNTTVKPHVKWNYEAPKNGLYLMYADITGGDDVKIMVNDVTQNKTYGMARSYIASIGYFNKGDKISVYADLEQGKNGTAKVYVNLLNEDVFEQGYEMLKDEYMTTTDLTGSSMEGTIDVKEDGLFYTSVPYEEGWTAYVDGEKVEITPIGKFESYDVDTHKTSLEGGSLIAFPLTKGGHEIRLVYYPKGFWIGFTVTSICIAAFAAICVYVYIIKKRNDEETLAEEEAIEAENAEAETARAIKAKKAKAKGKRK